MLAMVAEIILRKFFTPTIWAYDVSRMLYGVMFMLGSGYALMRGVHIRADFLYRLWAVRTQATVDFFLYLLLYFPGLLLFFWYAADYTWEGWERGERLDDTAWAPLVTPARLAMPVGVFLLLLQGRVGDIKKLLCDDLRTQTMSEEIIGLIMIAVMLLAIFVGFPISFTLIFLGLVFGYWGFGDLVFLVDDAAI